MNFLDDPGGPQGEGVLSIEGKEIVANTCWMKMDLKFYFFKT
jgi:hypothetical protein